MFLYSFLIDSAVMPYMYTGTKSLKNYVLVILLAHNFLFMKMSSFWYLFFIWQVIHHLMVGAYACGMMGNYKL